MGCFRKEAAHCFVCLVWIWPESVLVSGLPQLLERKRAGVGVAEEPVCALIVALQG